MKINKPILIAELGVNHNGDLVTAKKLIDLASKAKVNYTKIQIFEPDNFVLKNSDMAKYQKNNTQNKYKSQHDMLRNLTLSNEKIINLFNYAKLKKINLFASAFDNNSFKFSYSLNKSIIKIPSGEITNTPLLELIGSKNSLTLLSTGMSSENEIKKAVKILLKNGLSIKKLVLMHCVSNYPTKLKDLNLSYIPIMKKKFKCEVGFSDHSMGINASLAAIALGAKIIEKHFTFDKNAKGPDHKASINFPELKQLNQQMIEIYESLGQSKKIVNSQENQTKKIVRKMIVAASPIKKGDIFSIDNIMTIRPMKGLSADNWYKILGKKSDRNYKKFEKIKFKKI